MSKTGTLLADSILLLTFFGAAAYGQTTFAQNTAPDANLYTQYFFITGYQNLDWSVCGSTQSNTGCYAFGILGPFGQVGALIEGNPSVNATTNTVTRLIYIVDVAVGGGTEVILHVYKKTDVVTSSWDTVTVTPTRSVILPLIGGPTALCSMAANNGYLFIGTDQSPQAVQVQKSTLAMTQVGDFFPPINVTSITADKYGYVNVTFGGFVGGDNGVYQVGPDGKLVGSGGGAWFMLDTLRGLSTATLPLAGTDPTVNLQVHPKQRQQDAPKN